MFDSVCCMKMWYRLWCWSIIVGKAATCWWIFAEQCWKQVDTQVDVDISTCTSKIITSWYKLVNSVDLVDSKFKVLNLQ